MYELFTDEARKVMALANQEAHRLNHEYIGTEHILLSLLKAPGDLTSAVLKNSDVDLRKLRLNLERIILRGPQTVPIGSAPQAPRAKKVIEYALQEWRALKSHHVGSDHLLLGLMREQEGVASHVLNDAGLTVEGVRDQIAGLMRPEERTSRAPDRPATEIQDLPDELQPTASQLDAEIHRLTLQKEEAVGASDFEKAAALRDRAVELKRQKITLVHNWTVNRSIEAVWLSANDAAVKKLAQRINDDRRWQDLPMLADALEAAGCADRELIDHCRQPGEHSKQCWVVDMILAH